MKDADYAIQMERDGGQYYTQAAQSLKDQAAQNMLLSLARDEQRHEEVIKNLQSGNPAMIEGRDFAEIKNVFKLLADTKASFFQESDALAQVLQKAIQIEKKSVQLYQFLADQAGPPAQQEIWQKLAAEEQNHVDVLRVTLENIDTPCNILENAEFLFYNGNNAC